MSKWVRHVSRLVPSFMNIWTWGSSPRRGSRNACADEKSQSASQSSEHPLEFFSSVRSKWLPVTIGDHGGNLVISLWPGDKGRIIGVAVLGLNQLRPALSATPHPAAPQKFRGQKSAEKFSSRFFRIKTVYHHWLSSKGPNYHHLVLLISAGAIEGHFEGRKPREIHQGVLVLEWQSPAHLALAPRKNLTYLGFECLDYPPFPPDLAPSDYYLLSGPKKHLKGRHFSSETEVIAAAKTWLDGQSSEFLLSGLQTLDHLTKICIELIRGICSLNSEFCLWNVFPFW